LLIEVTLRVVSFFSFAHLDQPVDKVGDTQFPTKIWYKGYLNKKNEIANDQKAATMRTWVAYWVVLRGRFLLFYKDRKQACQGNVMASSLTRFPFFLIL